MIITEWSTYGTIDDADTRKAFQIDRIFETSADEKREEILIREDTNISSQYFYIFFLSFSFFMFLMFSNCAEMQK